MPGSSPGMTSRCRRHDFAISRHDLPELCQKLHALLQFRGRRECRMRAAPAVSCATCTKNMHMSIQGSGEHPTFPAQWLYGLWRALPGEQLFCLRSALGNRTSPRSIDASTATSGPHAFAVRTCRARQSQHTRPPHPRPTFVTCARPSDRDGMEFL